MRNSRAAFGIWDDFDFHANFLWAVLLCAPQVRRAAVPAGTSTCPPFSPSARSDTCRGMPSAFHQIRRHRRSCLFDRTLRRFPGEEKIDIIAPAEAATTRNTSADCRLVGAR